MRGYKCINEQSIAINKRILAIPQRKQSEREPGFASLIHNVSHFHARLRPQGDFLSVVHTQVGSNTWHASCAVSRNPCKTIEHCSTAPTVHRSRRSFTVRTKMDHSSKSQVLSAEEDHPTDLPSFATCWQRAQKVAVRLLRTVQAILRVLLETLNHLTCVLVPRVPVPARWLGAKPQGEVSQSGQQTDCRERSNSSEHHRFRKFDAARHQTKPVEVLFLRPLMRIYILE